MNLKEKHLLTGLSIDRIYTLFIRDYAPSFVFPGESHEMWEMDCILEGAAGITSGTKLYECNPGDLVIHSPDIFHTVWTSEQQSAQILTVTFNGEGDDSFVPHGKFILTENERMLIHLLKTEITTTFNKDTPAEIPAQRESDQILKCLLEALLLSLNRRRNTFVSASKNVSRFSEIAQYMKAHVCEPLNLTQICAECHIGKSALKDLFNHYTGSGTIKYFNYLRIRHAIKLMGLGLNMEEIARKMNFSSQNYFSTFFKRETGLSPLEYKQKKQINKN